VGGNPSLYGPGGGMSGSPCQARVSWHVWSASGYLGFGLSGIHPFQIDDEAKMLSNILSGKWSWLGSNWPKVSEEAKDLINGMLEKDQHKRLTVDQCLIHPWMASASDEGLEGIQDAIKNYQARKRLKGAILGVMSTNKMKKLMGKLREQAIAAHPRKITKLQIRLFAGKDLMAKDLNGKSDPYLLLFYAGTKFKSKTIRKSLSPTWDEEIIVPFTTGENLILQCWDWDFIGSDDFMGEIVIPASILANSETATDWFKLGQRSVDKKGNLLGNKHKKHPEKISGHIHIGIVKMSD